MIEFYKYQGTGNDFIMIDDRSGNFNLSADEREKLCDRRFGIGADGLILLQKDPEFDFRMVYHNADGQEGSMCGNGGRCTVKFAHDLGVFEKETRFIAVDGPHDASVNGTIVSLKMIDVPRISIEDGLDFADTGSPHVVVFKENIQECDVYQEGRAIRYSDYWLKRGGVNVNFVQLILKNEIYVRTYERGVEDETFSCGTGVTASALVCSKIKDLKSPVKINTKGGELEVAFEVNSTGKFQNIYLIGPALKVFKGVF